MLWGALHPRGSVSTLPSGHPKSQPFPNPKEQCPRSLNYMARAFRGPLGDFWSSGLNISTQDPPKLEVPTFGTQRPLATQTPSVPGGFSSPDPHPTTDLASVLGSGLITGKCLGVRRGHKASLYECPQGSGLAPGHYGKLPRNFAGVSRQRPAPAGKGHRVPRDSAARSSGTHVGTPGWRPAGPSTPHAGPSRPRHFNFFPWTPEGAGSGRRSRPGATRRP